MKNPFAARIAVLVCLTLGGAHAAAAPAVAVTGDPPPIRVSGTLRSEMFFTQRTSMRVVEPGTYARKSLSVFPFYEIVTVRADQLGHEGLSVHFQGIAGLDLAHIYFDQRLVADPIYGYVRWVHKGLDARLGRQFVFSGAAGALRLDGLQVAYTTPLSLGIEGFVGVPVYAAQGPDWYARPLDPDAVSYNDFGRGFSDWDSRSGDLAAGGRLYYTRTGVVSAGISFIQVLENKHTDRQLLGADLALFVLPRTALGAKGNFDLWRLALRDAKAYADVDIREGLTVRAAYEHVDPGLFLSHMSLFSVFGSHKYNTAKLAAFAALIPHLELDAGGGGVWYTALEPDGGGWVSDTVLGYQVEAGATYRFAALPGSLARVAYHRNVREREAVDQIRLSGRVPMGVPFLAAAAHAYLDVYGPAVNGQEVGFVGDVSLNFEKGPIAATAAFFAGTTPLARSEVKALATFTYRFAAPTK